MVGADIRLPHIVIEDLRCGTRQRAKARGLEFTQQVFNRDAQGMGALPYFQRREGMDMDGGLHRLDGPADINIGPAGVPGMNASLKAHFHRTALPGIYCARLDFRQRKVVGRATQRLG